MNSARNAYEKRLETFKQVITTWKSEKEIFDLYESCCTPRQVISLFRHQIVDDFNDLQKRNVLLLNDNRLVKMLRDIVPYSKEQHVRHLAMPQWWKIRFRHLDKSEEEVKQLAVAQQREWASNTHAVRKKKAHYNPKQTTQHWIDLGFSPADAQLKAREFKRSCSPFTVEFWKRKGFSEEQAQEKATALHVRGGTATCAAQDKKFVSKLEQDIFEQLQSRISRSLKQQHAINWQFVYDICDLEKKKIIEVNGTYWHADSRVYPKDDMIVCNGLTAAAVHARDIEKSEYAKNFGYQVLVIWEIDWHADKELSLQKMIEFLS